MASPWSRLRVSPVSSVLIVFWESTPSPARAVPTLAPPRACVTRPGAVHVVASQRREKVSKWGESTPGVSAPVWKTSYELKKGLPSKKVFMGIVFGDRFGGRFRGSFWGVILGDRFGVIFWDGVDRFSSKSHPASWAPNLEVRLLAMMKMQQSL